MAFFSLALGQEMFPNRWILLLCLLTAFRTLPFGRRALPLVGRLANRSVRAMQQGWYHRPPQSAPLCRGAVITGRDDIKRTLSSWSQSLLIMPLSFTVQTVLPPWWVVTGPACLVVTLTTDSITFFYFYDMIPLLEPADVRTKTHTIMIQNTTL